MEKLLWAVSCGKAAMGQGPAVVFDSLDTLKEGYKEFESVLRL
jgi:hypothetical protein